MIRRPLLAILLLSMFCLSCYCGESISEKTYWDEEEPGEDDDSVDDDDDASDDDASSNVPVVSSPAIVVPSPGLPPEVELMKANNNLDIVEHEGRLYLAFRTAPSHFASRLATIYVVSTSDQATWDFETYFQLDSDLREPRLLSWSGGLFLYFAVLGTNPLDFEPQGMMVSQYMGPADWTEPEWFYEPGFIAWRTKVEDGKPYMLAYVGGGSIYDVDPEPIRVHWLTTDDGYEWSPVVPDQPVVLEGGCSETDFAFLDDGSLVAVSRNEMGDQSGWGSNICRAPSEDLGNWECVNDPRKFDSPLIFRHGGDVFLIARRNLSGTGDYDLGYDDMSPIMQHLLYELLYWFYPKRTSLWKVDPQTLSVDFVLDLPSRGDTCFPGLVQQDEDRYLVYNYTSPLDGPDVVWVKGQLGPTQIVAVDLSFE